MVAQVTCSMGFKTYVEETQAVESLWHSVLFKINRIYSGKTQIAEGCVVWM